MSDREQLAVLTAALLLLSLGGRLLLRSAWALILVALALGLLALVAIERWRTRDRRLPIAPPPPGIVRSDGVLARACAELGRAPADAPRVLLVCGPEGSGKTTLVHAAAWQLREQFPDGVAYVNGRSDTDRPWSRAAICALLASYLRPDAMLPGLGDEEAVAALGERLADKRVLIVLDHIDALGSDFIRWLLTQLSPRSALLLTAEKPVALAPGLAALPQVPELLPLPARLPERDFLALLDGSGLRSEAETVRELTGGKLLLTRLVAGMSSRGLKPAELLARLRSAVQPPSLRSDQEAKKDAAADHESPLPRAGEGQGEGSPDGDLLSPSFSRPQERGRAALLPLGIKEGTAPANDAATAEDPDPQTAIIQLAVRSLDAAMQRSLHALSVFDDAFTDAHLVAASGPRRRQTTRALTRAGFLLRDPRPGHYRLHTAVRTELLGDLPDAERDAIVERLAAHVLRSLQAACAVLLTGDEVVRAQARRTVRAEWPHLLTCQAWVAVRAAQRPAAARLCVELGRATSQLDVPYFADDTATTRRFRDDAVRAARTLAEPAVLLECLLAAGRCCLAQRELQRAADCFEEYRQLAATGAAAPHLQDALAALAALYASRSEYDRALQRAEHRLELARAEPTAKSSRHVAEAVEQLGGLLSLAGQTERAVEVLGERLALASEPLDRFAALLPLAEATLQLGSADQALTELDEAVATARRLGAMGELGTALYCLGRAHMHLGEPRRAQDLLLEARTASKTAGQPVAVYDEREAELVGRLGDLALELGEQERAMALYDEQLVLAKADPRADVGLALANLALWHALRGDLGAADTQLKRFQELRTDRVRLDAIRRIGHLYLQLGNAGRALTVFREVLGHVRKGRHAMEEAVALLDVGVTLRRAGDARQAVFHLKSALTRARARKERRVEALASWELGLYHAGCKEIGAAVTALEVGIGYLDSIEYPRAAKEYQRNLALLNQLRQQLN